MLVAVGILGFVIAAFLIYTYSDLVMSPESSGQAAKKEKIKANLYFSDANERFLTAETRYVAKGATAAEQVIRNRQSPYRRAKNWARENYS